MKKIESTLFEKECDTCSNFSLQEWVENVEWRLCQLAAKLDAERIIRHNYAYERHSHHDLESIIVFLTVLSAFTLILAIVK